MVDGVSEIMTFEKAIKYLKTGKSSRYKITGEDKIPDVKIEPGKNNVFATHLLEGGTGLRYIQKLFGYVHSKTTEIFTYVSKANIKSIKILSNSILVEGLWGHPEVGISAIPCINT